MQTVDQSMTFTKESPKKEFKIDYNFSFIKINKIEMKSHWGKSPDEWGKIFSNTKVTFNFYKNDGKIEKFPYNLLQFISIYQKMPVIELNFELPSKDKRSYLTILNFYKKIDISFDIISDDYVEYNILYELTPGATLLE